MRFTKHVLPKRSGNLGVLMLNNPKPLHALTLDMVHCFQDVLQEWFKDETMKAFLIRSSEAKVPAFCAGGDVKQVYLSGQNNEDGIVHGEGIVGVGTADFFRDEYCLNYMLAKSPIPQISLWDGIVMGGGVGISIYGKYRVATEHTIFSMPETGIGLFPDVGSMYWMPRMLPFSIAIYMALTGARLTATDLLETGLATHYVPSSKIDDLEAALAEATTKSDDYAVQKVLDEFQESPQGQPSFDKASIDETFSPAPENVESLIKRLEMSSDTEFGMKTISTLKKMSPMSLEVTLEGLKRGKDCLNIGNDLAMEYRMSQAFMKPSSDFYEGIRAVLIDKDHRFHWTPPSLSDIKPCEVQAHFNPIQTEWTVPEHLMGPRRPISKI